MSRADITSTDVGVPITGTVTTTDTTVDLTAITSATLVIAGVGDKAAVITSSTAQTVDLKWIYDGTLSAGTYPCWWKLTFTGGVRTAPTGSTMSLQVSSVS